MPRNRQDALTGCLLGCAIGDALGVWCENLSRQRIARFGLPLDRYHLLFGHGMFSDDTEHLCLTAQALIVSAGEPPRFLRSLAWKLRWWLVGISAGIGYATLKACLKLWLGFPGTHSGVFSAGNGPAMRSPILGVAFGDEPSRLRELVRLSTRLTHTDPKAEWGALAVALAAHHCGQNATGTLAAGPYLAAVRTQLGDIGQEMVDLLERAGASAARGETTEDFALSLGLKRKVSGYIYHTVPVVLHAWLRYGPDLRTALKATIACGGDTDTTAAILGGIAGAGLGADQLPPDLLAGLWEWPRTVNWLRRLGERLAEVLASGQSQRSLRVFWPGVFVRNLFFLAVVVLHAFRRWLPPYG